MPKSAKVSFVILPLSRLNDLRVCLGLLLSLTHGLLPCKLLACNLALLQDNALEDVVCSEMDATGRGEDIAVSLRLTQQFDSFL